MKETLRAVQEWFADVVTRAGSVSARAPRIAAGGSLDPSQRLGIYRFGYGERLRGVMANDFPAVQHAIGAERFASLVDAYVRAHPSRHPNLNQLGARFPAFLERRRRAGEVTRFVVELAEFEGAIAKAHETAVLPQLDLASLRSEDSQDPAAMRLHLQPSVHLMSSTVDVVTWYEAWHRGAAPARPRRRRSWACVHRHGARIVRLPLDRRRFAVLQALAEGDTLAASLRHAGPGAPVAEWFREWARHGLFVAPGHEPASANTPRERTARSGRGRARVTTAPRRVR